MYGSDSGDGPQAPKQFPLQMVTVGKPETQRLSTAGCNIGNPGRATHVRDYRTAHMRK